MGDWGVSERVWFSVARWPVVSMIVRKPLEGACGGERVGLLLGKEEKRASHQSSKEKSQPDAALPKACEPIQRSKAESGAS
ncbi:MAG: hypothetical protein H6727_21065 [Myxococcales bacterium]|nr:hypothetical protein [Myxococcales bacterium]